MSCSARGMRHVQRVAAAGVVHVVTPVAVQAIVGGVVEAAEAERRPQVVALGGVVVDDVEDDLDPLLVEDLHHRLELVDLRSGLVCAGVPDVRREEADRVVAPVVRHPALDQVLVRHELMDGHQLHRRHPERPQMGQRPRRHQPRIRPAQVLRHIGMTRREPLDVHLVDDRLTPRNARRPIVPPRERRIDDDRLRHPRRAVAPIESQIRVRMPDLIPEQRITPRHRPINRPRIRIQQQLRRIEPMPRLRLPRPLHPIPIPHPRPRLRKVHMPHMLRLLRDRDARLPIPLKQTKLDPSSVLGKERKVDPRPIPSRAKRIGPPRPPTHRNGPRSRGHKRSTKRTRCQERPAEAEGGRQGVSEDPFPST